MLKPTELNPAYDAVIVAPDFHRVLLENNEVRVLEVVVPVGSKEPFHTHQWPSVFVVFGTPHLRYYIPDTENYLFEIEAQAETGVLYLAPEGMHSLENIDNRDLYAFRVELKRISEPDRIPIRGPVLEVGTPGRQLYLRINEFQVRAAHVDGGLDRQPSLLLRRNDHQPKATWLEGTKEPQSFEETDILITFTLPVAS